MKKCLIVVLIIATSFSSQAQNYLPINTQDTTGIWSVWDEKFFFLGDSAFNGQLYQKLWKVEDSVISTAQATYAGLFRQDAFGSAWLCRPGGNERLLFDISANTGDTLKVHPLFAKYHVLGPDPDSSFSIIVQHVDTVIIGGVARKRLAINNLPLGTAIAQYEYWIEGIGSTAGLPYTAQGNQVAIISWSTLLCYQENGQLVYYDTSYFQPVCYASPIGIKENALSTAVLLSPNPATDYINIELSLPNLQNTTATAVLYNLAGQEVLRQEVQFEGGKATIYLHENGSLSFGAGWRGVLQLKAKNHLIVEKITILR